MHQPDVVITEFYLLLCYVYRPQVSVAHALEFCVYFYKGQPVLLEDGGLLDDFSPVLLQDWFFLLLDGLMFGCLFETAWSELLVYIIHGAVTFSRFCAKGGTKNAGP